MSDAPPSRKRVASGIGPSAGIGLKAEHYREILEQEPDIGFFEIHAENYMGDGGPPHHYLAAIRERYPISLHGVGLSIGARRDLDRDHLRRLRTLNERYQPGLFSEHLAWSTHEAGYFGDLLPLPYTDETLARVRDHIDQTQEAMGRQMLLENPSSDLAFEESSMTEPDFIREIARATGCGLLLDVNNVFVSAHNLGTSATAYLEAYPMDLVQEFHLAGHDARGGPKGHSVLIDAHGSAVDDAVWELYAQAISRTGPLPTLIERDNDVPPLAKLIEEARRAGALLAASRQRAA